MRESCWCKQKAAGGEKKVASGERRSAGLCDSQVNASVVSLGVEDSRVVGSPTKDHGDQSDGRNVRSDCREMRILGNRSFTIDRVTIYIILLRLGLMA